MNELTDRVVLIAGATSASGRAVARALLETGATVVAVGSDQGRLEAMEAELPGLVGERADLTDNDDVLELAMRVHARVGVIDGVVHLVGGWRGGGGIPGQTEEDYRVLEHSFTALRHVSRAFWDDLVASPAGRIAMVSSTTVASPTAGGANYTAVKAASESWMHSLAQGFARAARAAADAAESGGRVAPDAGESGGRVAPDAGGRVSRPGAAAVIFRVTSLAGLEDRLAASVIDLWRADAAELNGSVTELTAG